MYTCRLCAQPLENRVSNGARARRLVAAEFHSVLIHRCALCGLLLLDLVHVMIEVDDYGRCPSSNVVFVPGRCDAMIDRLGQGAGLYVDEHMRINL